MPVNKVIKLRGGTTVQWAAANPVLSPREVGIETDTNKFKFGDGLNAWSSLPYAVAAASGSSTINWADIIGKPGTFTPSAHTHEIADVNGLQTDLNTLESDVSALQTSVANKIDATGVARMMGWADNTIEPRPRAMITATTNLTTQNIRFTYFTPAVNITVSQITMASNSTASGLSLARMGVYQITGTNSGTLLARTASDTTLFTSSSTLYTRNFDVAGGYPASITLNAGTLYAIAVITIGTNAGNLLAYATPTANWAADIPPRMSGQITTTQSDLPSSPNSITATTAAPWGRLS